MAAKPLSLYLHIPFCTLKCAYCDFNSYAKLDELIPPFVDALLAEINLWAPAMRDRRVDTVFFGGGTPSLLPLADLQRIIAQLCESFDIAPGAEVSLEANPGTVDGEYLSGLLAAGVNRMSFGVQSFHDDELAALDRIHSSADAKQCVRCARQARFQRINLDLIYGLPEQPLERWQSNVEQALELAPEHLSLYALTVEDGTKLAYDVEHGRVPGPDPDLQAAMYKWSCARLGQVGYRQYEISNWCRPGGECRHNLVYWRNGDWLGLGPGAHSHLRSGEDAYRFADVYSPKQYIRLVVEAIGNDIDPELPLGELLPAMKQVTFVEPQPRALQMADTAILALRLNDGLAVDGFRARFGVTPEETFVPVVEEMTAAGVLERANGHLRLTDRGRYVANEVFVRLLPD